MGEQGREEEEEEERGERRRRRSGGGRPQSPVGQEPLCDGAGPAGGRQDAQTQLPCTQVSTARRLAGSDEQGAQEGLQGFKNSNCIFNASSGCIQIYSMRI